MGKAAVWTLALGGFAIALTTLVLTCALTNNWWPMISFIIYVLIPVPWLFFSYQNDEDAECSDLVNQFGFCTSGMIFSSLFGLPFACYVSGKVDDDGVMTGWTIANLSILISITFIIYLVSKGDD